MAPPDARARGGTSTVTVTATSQQPLNVTAPTDHPTALFPRRPTTSGYPGGGVPRLRRPNTRSSAIRGRSAAVDPDELGRSTLGTRPARRGGHGESYLRSSVFVGRPRAH